LDINGNAESTTLDCQACGQTYEEPTAEHFQNLIARVSLSLEVPRFAHLLRECITRIPRTTRLIRFDTRIRLKKKGNLPGVVGLTTFLVNGYKSKGQRDPAGRHTITFYTELLSQLSDRAVVAVMAHELAHAWLNEHIGPEASQEREEDADTLAEMWGFGPELAALNSETEPVHLN
jgi:hypothetical protein